MRRALLSLCGSVVTLLATAGTTPADPLTEVTQAEVRARVAAYLHDRPDAVANLTRLVGVPVRVDAESIEYTRAPDGTPVRLVWRYHADAALTVEQDKVLVRELTALLDSALGQYAAGSGQRPLLSSADFAAVHRVYAFEPESGPPASALPPPPMPMAGRVFPVYPLLPASPCGAVSIAYAGETFSSADVTGYFLYAAPAMYWSVPAARWVAVPHPQAAEITARFAARAESVRTWATAAAAYDAGCAAYWAGDYRGAREALEAAVALDRRDARAWQYLALTDWALGDDKAGTEAARHGAAAAVAYPEENASLLAALERIQGPTRRRLGEAAAGITTRADAETVLARVSQK